MTQALILIAFYRFVLFSFLFVLYFRCVAMRGNLLAFCLVGLEFNSKKTLEVVRFFFRVFNEGNQSEQKFRNEPTQQVRLIPQFFCCSGRRSDRSKKQKCRMSDFFPVDNSKSA